MPHANIWIRKDDMEKWLAIENKSEFIANALQGVPLSQGAAKESLPPKPLKAQVERSVGFCKHGSPFGLCRFNCKK